MSARRTAPRGSTSRGRSTRPPADPPRSLADDLRRRDDADLAALLSARPDLLHPVPADLTALAVRAAGPSAVRALDRLDRLTVQVAEVVAALSPPVTREAVLDGVGADAGTDLRAAVDRALHRLRTDALLWGTDDDLHLVRPVVDALGRHPCGLLPPAVDTGPVAGRIAADPARLETELAAAPAAAREALDALAWGPPVGRVADAQRPVSRETARTPIEWLLARDLLVATGPDTVTIPREVALALRGGVLVAEPAYPPREPTASAPRDLALVDRTAGGHAYAAVRAVTDLLDAWSATPPPVLRSGGLAVRDLAAATRLLDCDEPTAALVVEVAYAAGLVAGDLEVDESWAPTPAYDAWLEREPGPRWAVLARAWLTTPRAPGLVGTRDPRDGRVNALSDDVERPAVMDIRRQVLAILADLPEGAATTAEELSAVLDDRRPRRAGPARDDLVRWTLREAEALGVTGLGALSTPGRVLLAGADERPGPARGERTWPLPPADLVAAVDPLLPQPLDHVLLQADLTAVAPGPLVAELARELRVAADVESTGGATVFRFTETSIRRALDAGRDAAGLLSLLERHSRTPVPQPLRYLVEDVGRRHGSVRVGTASSYVRCDDETTLTALLADRRTVGLGLVRLAPTVLAAQAGADEVLAALRAAGLAPAAESPDGSVLVRRPDLRRAPVRPLPARAGSGEPGRATPALLDAAVRALRAGDRATTAGPPGRSGDGAGPGSTGSDGPAAGGDGRRLPRSSPTRTLEVLRGALDASRPVLIGFVDPAGTTSQRLVEPVRLAGGFLTAYDHRQDEVRTFPIARITGVTTLDDADA